MKPDGSLRLKRALPLLIALLAVLGVTLHFCLWKSGMFIDEIYTYGLSNSHEMPFIGHGAQDQLAEQRITREDFFDYLAVTDTDPLFDVVSVYDNQVQDVHPPLHYWIINFCSSLARGQFSKWIGLIPDLIIQLGTLCVLYALGMELFKDRWIAALTALLFGLSQVGLSIAIMIRMYVLMCFWTALLALLTAKELWAPTFRWEIGIGLCIFAGLMTQYYFVFYAFFLCLVTGIVLLCRQEWKAALRFGLCALVGVGLMLVCFPAVLTQMTGNRLGPDSDALENLRNLAGWAGRLRYYFGQIRVGLRWAVLLACVTLALAAFEAFVRKRKPEHPVFSRDDLRVLYLLIPVIPTVFIAALISPVVEGRYIYNIMPVCVLAAGWCFSLLKRVRNDVRLWCACAAVIALLCSLRTIPDYLYPEHRDYDAVISEHAEDPCVYLTEYFAGITQDMLQLMQFEDVYVTGDTSSEGLAMYLDTRDADELVVYIDVSGFWGSAFRADVKLAELLDGTDYTVYERLYAYGLSDTYLLRK